MSGTGRPSRNSATSSRFKDVIEQLAPKKCAKNGVASSKRARTDTDAANVPPASKRGRHHKSKAAASEQDGNIPSREEEMAGGEVNDTVILSGVL